MNDEEIRVAVAIKQGWTNLKWRENRNRINKIDRLHGSHPTGGCRVPNFPEDLNACAEFEETLEDKLIDYDRELKLVMSEGARVCDWSPYPSDYIWNAKPRQRCKAFLRVHGLWKEESK